MTIGYRLLLYIALVIVGGLVVIWLEYQESLKALEHDPSAMAAWGFFVFFWPIFFFKPALVVAVIAGAIEAGLFFWSLTFRDP